MNVYFRLTIYNWPKTNFERDLFSHNCLSDLPPAITDNILMKALLFRKNYSPNISPGLYQII